MTACRNQMESSTNQGSRSCHDITNEVKKPVGGQLSRQSCMKVSTLEDSLKSIQPRSRRRSSSLRESVKRMRRGSSQVFRRKSIVGKGMDESNRTTTRKSSSRVVFSDIEIREYEMTASDNPGVSKGPGIGIGWKYVEMESLSVELFEKHHPPRRSMKEIKVTTRERMDRLRDSGYTQREIQQIVKQINIAKRKRQGTLDRMKLHTAHEKVSHFVHRLFKRR